MINLLSSTRKDELRAARANVLIVRYMAIIALAFAFIGGAMYVSRSILESTMVSAQEIIENNDVKADVYRETKQEVDSLTARLSEANTLLSSEVRYSKVLLKLGQAMPTGTILGDLTLSDASFSAQSELVAYAKTTTEATQLQTQLQASGLFSQISIKSTEADKGIDGYPVLVSMTATFSKTGIR